MLTEKKYCETCKKIYELQVSNSCGRCQSVVQSTFLVDERFRELQQFKANRSIKRYNDFINKE